MRKESYKIKNVSIQNELKRFLFVLSTKRKDQINDPSFRVAE